MAEKEIIGRMNAFRERNGTSKAEMSRQLDVDPGTFSNINAGDTINRLVARLEEKDKQISQLLQLLAEK